MMNLTRSDHKILLNYYVDYSIETISLVLKFLVNQI